MPTFIKKPTKIEAEGNKTKIIEEYIRRINSKTEDLSVAHMKSPSGWIETGKQPEFDEYAIVQHSIMLLLQINKLLLIFLSLFYIFFLNKFLNGS